MPGPGLVDPPHLLAQVSQSLVQIRMWRNTKRFEPESLVVDSCLRIGAGANRGGIDASGGGTSIAKTEFVRDRAFSSMMVCSRLSNLKNAFFQ